MVEVAQGESAAKGATPYSFRDFFFSCVVLGVIIISEI